jgi:hypothetical protein
MGENPGLEVNQLKDQEIMQLQKVLKNHHAEIPEPLYLLRIVKAGRRNFH